MRFAIFTHVEHIKAEGLYYGYAPYVREMNIWLKYVEEVEVVAPLYPPPNSNRDQKESLIEKAYNHSCLCFTRIPFINLLSFAAIIKTVFSIPIVFFNILRAMHRADHLHLRCPGNIGLIACICQIFFPGKPKTAKYAGNWNLHAKQPWSYKLQKSILSNTFLTRNMTVLVYGEWLNQTKNILPFFTASFSESEREIINKSISVPYKFLFIGNLVPGKQPEVAIKIVENLNKRNIPATLHIYGDGELMSSLQEQAANKTYINLHGNQPLEVLKQAYKDAHFLILASKSEGWPKVVAEAMWFGCIPVVTAVSCVPWMLGGGSRGILISEGKAMDVNQVESGKWNLSAGAEEDSQDGVDGVKSGLLDTFQKNRQFECFPETAGAVSENVSRTGFSETLEVTKSENVIDITVVKIIELINNPKEMKRMSMEAQEWSQEYTLEKFEAAIKKLLASSV